MRSPGRDFDDLHFKGSLFHTRVRLQALHNFVYSFCNDGVFTVTPGPAICLSASSPMVSSTEKGMRETELSTNLCPPSPLP